MTSVPVEDVSQQGTNRFYFIAWRWHFYAGLYVIPFLVMLAVTGLIMLWISALSDIHGERSLVQVTGTPQPVSALFVQAEAAVPGAAATQYIEPLAADRVAVVKVESDSGASAVVIDPYSGAVVDVFPWRAGWYDFASDIHGTLLIGDLGDYLIEAAASLGVILVISGLYLHWPRKAGVRRMLVPDLAAKGRGLWKSLHGVVGVWMSVVMLVFLISGLSWAGIWGGKMVQAWNTFPAEKWGAPLSDKTHATMNHGAANEVPWTLEQTPLPVSGSLVGVQAIAAPVTVDGAVDFARKLGFAGRFQLNLPQSAEGVWTISHDSMSNDGTDPWRDRTIHIDQYTGNVLADVGYADYSAYAKAMAWGIAFHEGDMGVWNIALNTLFCLSMIFLPLSGLVMWWKRRPEGAMRIAAPPRPRDLPFWKLAAVVVALLGAMFPLAGALMLAILVLDWLLIRRVPALRRALS